MKSQRYNLFIILTALVISSLACGLGSSTPTGVLKIGNDGMTLVYIPAGEFIMGTDNPYAEPRIMPAHKVILDAFWIDKTEVTNKMYATCVRDGKCALPNSDNTEFGRPEFDNHPVTNILWLDANDYCSWAGRRLPTDAEWEKAARGTDERLYPWGNSLIFSSIKRGRSKVVGSTSIDASPYGVLDMYANVSEWVADWYDADYYKNSPSSNPLGPSENESKEKVIRGQANQYFANDVTLLERLSMEYDWWDDAQLGFRCAIGESLASVTAMSVPFVTATPIHLIFTETVSLLSDINIEPLLVQTGDLPDIFSSGQISKFAPNGIYDNAPKPEKLAVQEIINTQAQFGEGYVAVGLYPLSNVDIAYESLKNLTHFGGEVSSSAYQNPGIGEKLTVFLSVSGFYSTEVVFTRCHTVVYIMLKYQKPPNLTSVLSYAAKLDARLAEVACLK